MLVISIMEILFEGIRVDMGRKGLGTNLSLVTVSEYVKKGYHNLDIWLAVCTSNMTRL
jgi:hypothetical protein